MVRCLRGKGSKVGYDLLEGAKRQGGAFGGKESKVGNDLREGAWGEAVPPCQQRTSLIVPIDCLGGGIRVRIARRIGIIKPPSRATGEGAFFSYSFYLHYARFISLQVLLRELLGVVPLQKPRSNREEWFFRSRFRHRLCQKE